MAEQTKKVNKRKLEGVVVSEKMKNTRIVAVTRLTKHPRFHKYYKVTKRFAAHDAENAYKLGDAVVIEETKPMSRTKRWIITSKAGK
jgi:small subunit ribosomal protein S17